MTKNQFRAIVGASIALSLISGIAIFAVASPLPEELDRWMTVRAEAGLRAFDWFSIAMAIPLIVSTIGLFYFARWSRALYAATVSILAVSTLFAGPWVSTALETFASNAAQLFDGLIIGLAYFSDARYHFESHAEPAPA